MPGLPWDHYGDTVRDPLRTVGLSATAPVRVPLPGPLPGLLSHSPRLT